MRHNTTTMLVLIGLFLLSGTGDIAAQDIQIWCYATFESVMGKVEVCPTGEPGIVMVHSEWPSDLLAGSPAAHDTAGRPWSAADYERLTFRYSTSDGHFKLERYDYRKLNLLPESSSWDFGHSTDLTQLLPPYIGSTAPSPLPTGAKIKWIEPYELDHQRLTVLFWEPQEATELNVWVVASDGKASKVVARMPALKSEGFQGVQVMDCLGQNHRDLVLYTIGVGARFEFPSAHLLRIRPLQSKPKLSYEYGFNPSHWLEKKPSA